MPHTPLPDHLPGITGLLEYRLDTALPIRELTQILLQGESTLSPGERELITALVSARNDCAFCCDSHASAARFLFHAEKAWSIASWTITSLGPFRTS